MPPPDRLVVQGFFRPIDRMLVFPSNLRNPEYKDRPTMQFTCKDADKEITIFLPCPGGITFADSGSYGEFSTQTIAGNILRESKKLRENLGKATDYNKDRLTNTANDAATAAAAAAKGVLSKVTTSDAIVALNQSWFGGDLAEQTSFDQKVVMDPRINTSFTGNGMRSFSFEFKMIATSPEESKTVEKIVNAFRRNIYASKKGTGSLLALSYPPLWEVKFLKGDKNENTYIPKIAKCYLTGLNTVFNGDNNSWRVDTAPLSVNISISFQEQKTLLKEDIEELETETPDRIGAGNVGFLNSLQSGFKKSVNKKLDSLKNEITDIFKF